MRITIVGTGYVGLVTGVCLAHVGHEVTCFDIDKTKIERIARGESPIFEPGLEDLMRAASAQGRFLATVDSARAFAEAQVIFIAVGTPSRADGSTDMQFVFSAVDMIADHASSSYVVIVNKSTVPIGSTETVAARMREKHEGEFDVVANPELLREGHAVEDFLHPARILIGSTSDRARQVMEDVYAPFDTLKLFIAPRSAELAKYAANVFLATKVSFINEMACFAEAFGADIHEVARAIGTDKRIGEDFLRAGLGWGGSCFPKDTRAMEAMARMGGFPASITSATMLVNKDAHARPIERLARVIGGISGKRIALLGLSFKKDTDDTRESPALEVAKSLSAQGARVFAYDPRAVLPSSFALNGFERVASLMEACESADAVFIATDWDEFKTINPVALSRHVHGRVMMDARNLLDASVMHAAGWVYLGVGRGA